MSISEKRIYISRTFSGDLCDTGVYDIFYWYSFIWWLFKVKDNYLKDKLLVRVHSSKNNE